MWNYSVSFCRYHNLYCRGTPLYWMFTIFMFGFDREWRLLQLEQQGCQYILLLPKRAISVIYLQKGKPSQLFSMFWGWEQAFNLHPQFVHQCKERYNYLFCLFWMSIMLSETPFNIFMIWKVITILNFWTRPSLISIV